MNLENVIEEKLERHANTNQYDKQNIIIPCKNMNNPHTFTKNNITWILKFVWNKYDYKLTVAVFTIRTGGL